MNYKKMWNSLKEEMIKAEETAEFLRAGEILMRMVKEEVAECKKDVRLTEEIDLSFVKMVGGKK